jgi:hypothetical protein
MDILDTYTRDDPIEIIYMMIFQWDERIYRLYLFQKKWILLLNLDIYILYFILFYHYWIKIS